MKKKKKMKRTTMIRKKKKMKRKTSKKRICKNRTHPVKPTKRKKRIMKKLKEILMYEEQPEQGNHRRDMESVQI